jgi:hypothetical protein
MLRVLFVDDEVSVHEAMRRTHEKRVEHGVRAER